jgi:hypothetical protein
MRRKLNMRCMSARGPLRHPNNLVRRCARGTWLIPIMAGAAGSRFGRNNEKHYGRRGVANPYGPIPEFCAESGPMAHGIS